MFGATAVAGPPVNEVQQGYADTWDIGGSRWGMYSAQAFDPYSYVGTTTVVPMALLSAPPTYGQLDASTSAAYATGPGGGTQASTLAQSAPWNPKTSPLVPTIVAIVVGVYLFHYLYYKDRKRR
jgi:hypothetical protein